MKKACCVFLLELVKSFTISPQRALQILLRCWNTSCEGNSQYLGWWNGVWEREPGVRTAQSDWQLRGYVLALIPLRLWG